jgi:hypothetical protein
VCAAGTRDEDAGGSGPDAGTAPGAGSAPPPPGGAALGGESVGGESPGAAFVLGLIPGVGAIYNAEYFKAAAHIVVFALLIHLSDRLFFGLGNLMFGMLAFGFYCYMPFEAYYTAKKRLLRREGVRLETPFDRINQELEGVPDKDWWGGIALIAVGGVFLLDNFRILSLDDLLRFWPAALIALGIWLLLRFRGKES